MTTVVDADYVQTYGQVEQLHPDFTPVPTPWGTQHLHKDGYVWFVHYPLANVRRSFHGPITKGKWQAFFANERELTGKPWCQSNWRLGGEDGVQTKEEAILLCQRHVEVIEERKRS